MVPNFVYINSYYFFNTIIIIIIIIILIFLLPTYSSLGGNATKPNIFQHLIVRAKFDQHTISYKWLCVRSKIIRKKCAKVSLCLFYTLFRVKWAKQFFFQKK